MSKKRHSPAPAQDLDLSPSILPELRVPEVRPRSQQEYLITVQDGMDLDALAVMESKAGVSGMVSTLGMSASDIADTLRADDKDGIFFSRLGMAAVVLDDDQVAALRQFNGEVIKSIEVSPIFYPLAGLSSDYLRGWRDCADALSRNLEPGLEAASIAPSVPERQVTWGIKVTGVHQSRYAGKGIRVAILDTGLDMRHPDFIGRHIVHESFIPGESSNDKNGHGTHCAGTACGPLQPKRGERYGIASEAELYIGKVLSDSGPSRGLSVVTGMEWALAQQCQIVSMSLGAAVLRGARPIAAYERLGSRALAAGTLIIAAAGNDSDRRRNMIQPVSSPADSPSIMAVGAIDSGMNVARFSNGGINPGGGGVDIAAPGVDILSSVPTPGYTKEFNGTSMATPHVAGIAALWAEATGKRGRELWDAVVQSASQLAASPSDVGAGLVQAP